MQNGVLYKSSMAVCSNRRRTRVLSSSNSVFHLLTLSFKKTMSYIYITLFLSVCVYVHRLEATLDTLGDTAIDLPDIWFDAAELITPMLYQGGIPMGQLFR